MIFDDGPLELDDIDEDKSVAAVPADVGTVVSKFLRQTVHARHSSSGTQYAGLAESLRALKGYSKTTEAKLFKVPITFSPYLHKER